MPSAKTHSHRHRHLITGLLRNRIVDHEHLHRHTSEREVQFTGGGTGYVPYHRMHRHTPEQETS